MFRCLSFIIYGISILLLCGCSAKLEILSLSDGAFVKENLPVFISMKNSSYPLLSEEIKSELEKQIKKDGFTIDEQNASYYLNMELLSHDKSAYYRYEPIYGYSYLRCVPNGKCYKVPAVKYIPCVDVSETIYIMIDAFDKSTNETKEFPLTNRSFADNCHYGFRFSNGFNSDTFLLNTINKESIKLLAARIKENIFPIKTIQKEKLLDEIKSAELSQKEIDIFKKSYKMASDENYKEAILGFENLKDMINSEIPYEIYLNLGLLYEYIGDLDKALENYKYLTQKMPETENYIKRIYVKKRYEKQ
ncbi:MAG: hypothetical protein LBT96_01755 [Campylobacteraceae bacterium]|nr:hypothetical protein [Campylobacteraceae bacterium]